MPRKDGRGQIRVVIPTSSDEVDVPNADDLGASSYITKPVTHAQLIEVMQMVARHWSEVVELPDMAAV